jgi:hypothetical protein
MRLGTLGWMVVPTFLAACGGDKPAATLSVNCSGSLALSGARSIDVLGDMVNGRITMSFPDPVNTGKANTLVVPPHDRCTISPAIGSGG